MVGRPAVREEIGAAARRGRRRERDEAAGSGSITPRRQLADELGRQALFRRRRARTAGSPSTSRTSSSPATSTSRPSVPSGSWVDRIGVDLGIQCRAPVRRAARAHHPRHRSRRWRCGSPLPAISTSISTAAARPVAKLARTARLAHIADQAGDPIPGTHSRFCSWTMVPWFSAGGAGLNVPSCVAREGSRTMVSSTRLVALARNPYTRGVFWGSVSS